MKDINLSNSEALHHNHSPDYVHILNQITSINSRVSIIEAKLYAVAQLLERLFK